MYSMSLEKKTGNLLSGSNQLTDLWSVHLHSEPIETGSVITSCFFLQCYIAFDTFVHSDLIFPLT